MQTLQQTRGNFNFGVSAPTNSRVTVSVIIPTLNEAQNLPLVLPFLPLDQIDEVILVDGRSTDGTIEIAKKLLPSIKVVEERRPGKGIALRSGYEAASGDILIVLDADGSNDPREIPRFIRALMEGADFVKGSRFAPQGGTTDMPRYRMAGNWVFTKLANLLFNISFTDLCYGYHAFWRESLDVIDLSDINGFEIDTAIYLQAVRGRLRIIDIPSFEGARFYGMSNLKTIPDGFQVLKTIFYEWFAGLKGSSKQLQPGFRGIKPVVVYSPLSIPAVNFQDNNGPAQSKIEPLNISMGLLSSVCSIFSKKLDTRMILERILHLILETLRAESGSLILFDDQENVIDGCLVYHQETHELPESSFKKIIDQGLAGWVVKNRQPALVANTSQDPRWYKTSWEKGVAKFRSAISLPLFDKDRLVGVLTFVGEQEQQFAPEDLELVTQALLFNEQTSSWRQD